MRIGLLITLALVWTFLAEDPAPADFLVGLLAAAFVLRFLAAPVIPLARWRLRKTPTLLYLIAYFLWELLKSNYAVALLVLRPRLALRPGILAYPLRVHRPGQITALANMISLTPGTLSVEVDADARTLYIHCIDATDPEAALAAPRRFEALIAEVSS